MIEKKKQNLVLFDFDGTLTNRDTLFAFLKYFKGSVYFITNIILSLPILIGYKVGMLDGDKAKERLLTKFLKNVSENEFKNRCELFGKEKISKFLNKPVFEKFQSHLNKGDRVIIVSASIVDWILPWANLWGVEVIATKMVVDNGVLTGTFEGKNCNNEEKAERIKTYLDLSEFDEIWAYGDSSGDKYMMELANHRVKI